MSDPIYNNDPLFGSNLLKTSCPSRSDIRGDMQDETRKGVLETSTYKKPPNCDDKHFTKDIDNSVKGCCVVEAANMTCDDYLTADIKNSTNFKSGDYDIGIDFYATAIDTSGRQICHSVPIRKRVVNIREFIYTILISLVYILLAAYFGSCYEFWFKYGAGGNGNECLKFKNNCKVDMSPIDHAFPDKGTKYPYFTCDPRATSSNELFHNFLKFGVFEIQSKDTNQDYGTKIVRVFQVIVKSFVLNFFYTLLFSRKSLNFILKSLSVFYKDLSHTAKNILFLFISGIAFYVIAKYTNNPQINSGIIFVFYGLAFVVIVTTLFTFFTTNLYFAWKPNELGRFFPDELNMPEYFSLVNDNNFFPIWINLHKPIVISPTPPLSMQNRIMLPTPPTYTTDPAHKNPFIWLQRIHYGYVVLNITIFIVLLCALIVSFGTGFVGALFGLFYMIFHLTWNIFGLPWYYRKECCYTIIKDHSELLILLFCSSIVLSATQHLNSTSTGLISAIVGVIILYKLVKNIKE